MADDPVFEAGTARLPIGTKISADDVGGALYQRVKLVWGANGTAVEVDSLTATALPVFIENAAAIGGGTGLVSITGSVNVAVTSAVPFSLTGSFIDAASNAIRGSLTAASRLFSLTGTVSAQITSMPAVSLTGSFVDGANNALRSFIVNAISLSAGVTVASLTVTVKNGLFSITGSVVDGVNNALRVNVVAGAGSGGTAQADESAFTYGTTNITPIGATIAADSITGSVVGAVRMTTARGLHVSIRDATGVNTPAIDTSVLSSGNARLAVWSTNGVSATQASLSAGNLTSSINSLLTDLTGIIAVQLVGTWAGDIFFEATVDGTNYHPIDALPASGNTYVNQTTANGLWYIQCTGSTLVRARASLSSGVANIHFADATGGNVRAAAGSGSSGGLVSVTGTVSVQITSMSVPVSLTGSFVDSAANAIRVSLTSVPAHLVSVTGTVSVQITSQPEQTLTGSYVDSASNALRGSLTAASRLFSLTGTASVQITSAVSLSVQITSMIVPVSLTGSFISANNALRVEGTLTFSVAITSAVPFSLTGSFINLANNALRVEGTLTFLAETRYAVPATSKLTRANIDFSTSASSTIVAGVGGQTIRIMKIMFTSAAATTFNFESSTSALSGLMTLPANGALILDLDGEPWYVTSTADPFRLHINAASQIGGTVWYTQS